MEKYSNSASYFEESSQTLSRRELFQPAVQVVRKLTAPLVTDTNSSASEELIDEKNHSFSRRQLPKEFLLSAGKSELLKGSRDFATVVTAIMAGMYALAGLQPPGEMLKYLLPQESSLTFIPGSHATPESWPVKLPFHYPGQGRSMEDVEHQESKGDIDACDWPDATLEEINQRMKEAKERGRDYYYIAVDSEFGSLNSSDWSWLPRPWPLKDLPENAKKLYPEHIMIVGAETFEDFYVGPNLIPQNVTTEQFNQVSQLEDEVNAWYDCYSKENANELVESGKQTVIDTLLHMLIAQGLLTPLLKQQTINRRLLIEGAIAAVFLLRVGGNIEELGDIAGQTGNQETQKLFSELQSITGETFGSHRLLSLLLARTAWAIEKADYISKKNNNQPIDILYGDAHTDQVPSMMIDPQFRKQIITQFMRQHVQALKEAILQKSSLAPFLDDILYYSTCGIAFYTINELNVPWGHKTLPKDFSCSKINNNYILSYASSVYQMAEEVLAEIGIDIMKYHTNKPNVGINFYFSK